MSSEPEPPSLEHSDSVSRPHSPPLDSTDVKGAVVCVFCGASEGITPAHMEAAKSLGRAFHENNVKLVYGGGMKGMMGQVTHTLVSLSGPDAVHGIIPEALRKFEQMTERDEKDFGRMTVVPSMHVRKQTMVKEVQEGGPGSGFIALTGGYGTLEELAEMATWNQLKIHNRGIVVFNVEGYWDLLLEWVKKASTTGFIKPEAIGIIQNASSAEGCLTALKDYVPGEGQLKLDWTQT